MVPSTTRSPVTAPLWSRATCHGPAGNAKSELRVSELAPGETTDPFKFGLDEIVYVLEGRGITTVWSDDDQARKSFGDTGSAHCEHNREKFMSEIDFISRYAVVSHQKPASQTRIDSAACI